MKKSDIIETLEPVVAVLSELGIPYCISGSIASSAKGIPRTTLDVDIVTMIPPGRVQDLEKKLKNKYYISLAGMKDAIKNRSSFNLIHLETMIKVDVYIMKNNEYDVTSFRRRSLDSIDDNFPEDQFFIATSEDIILSKLEWYKMGFETSERQWGDIIGVLKVQSQSLDYNYLNQWAKELKVEELLSQAINKAGVNG